MHHFPDQKYWDSCYVSCYFNLGAVRCVRCVSGPQGPLGHLRGEWVKWPNFVGRADEEIHTWQGAAANLSHVLIVGFTMLNYVIWVIYGLYMGYNYMGYIWVIIPPPIWNYMNIIYIILNIPLESLVQKRESLHNWDHLGILSGCFSYREGMGW
jgi:hypothetical protein